MSNRRLRLSDEMISNVSALVSVSESEERLYHAIYAVLTSKRLFVQRYTKPYHDNNKKSEQAYFRDVETASSGHF